MRRLAYILASISIVSATFITFTAAHSAYEVINQPGGYDPGEKIFNPVGQKKAGMSSPSSKKRHHHKKRVHTDDQQGQ